MHSKRTFREQYSIQHEKAYFIVEFYELQIMLQKGASKYFVSGKNQEKINVPP